MAFNRARSWFRNKVIGQVQNEVRPIHITVEPRITRRIESPDTHSANNSRILEVENDIRQARYLNFLCKPKFCVSTSDTIDDIRISQDAEAIEIFTLPNEPVRYICTIQDAKFVSTRYFTRNCVSEAFHQVVLTLRQLGQIKCLKPCNNIHFYMKMMYIFGTSSISTDNSDDIHGLLKYLKWIVSKVQWILFITVVTLSAFEPFCQAKYVILWFLCKGGFNRFVRFSYRITCLATSMYGAYTFCYNWDIVKKMTHALTSYENKWEIINKKPVFCIATAMVTIILALLKAILIVDSDHVSLEEALLETSVEMSEDLFMWSSKSMNVTFIKLSETFGSDLNSLNMLLAVTKIIRDFAFHLQHGMMWDLIGIIVVTLFSWIKFFMIFVSEVVENVLDESSEEWRILQRKREHVWMIYREIRVVFEAVNDVIGPLLLLFHATNVLRYAFFMEHLIYPGDAKTLTYVDLIYNIVKSEIIYMIASRIAQQNKEIRKWLRNWGSRTGKVNLGYTEIDMNAVLDELDEEPLGLGKGDYVIHSGFHFGLLGLVSSLFVMLASKKQ